MSFSVYEEELQRKAMEAAGFIDIQQYEYKVRMILTSIVVGMLTWYDRLLSVTGPRTRRWRNWDSLVVMFFSRILKALCFLWLILCAGRRQRFMFTLRMLEGRLTRASIMLTSSSGLSGDGSQRSESMWKG
ncbi:hypothetical protein SNK03_010715 [Fusarium graminearum]